MSVPQSKSCRLSGAVRRAGGVALVASLLDDMVDEADQQQIGLRQGIVGVDPPAAFAGAVVIDLTDVAASLLQDVAVAEEAGRDELGRTVAELEVPAAGEEAAALGAA